MNRMSLVELIHLVLRLDSHCLFEVLLWNSLLKVFKGQGLELFDEFVYDLSMHYFHSSILGLVVLITASKLFSGNSSCKYFFTGHCRIQATCFDWVNDLMLLGGQLGDLRVSELLKYVENTLGPLD